MLTGGLRSAQGRVGGGGSERPTGKPGRHGNGTRRDPDGTRPTRAETRANSDPSVRTRADEESSRHEKGGRKPPLSSNTPPRTGRSGRRDQRAKLFTNSAFGCQVGTVGEARLAVRVDDDLPDVTEVAYLAVLVLREAAIVRGVEAETVAVVVAVAHDVVERAAVTGDQDRVARGAVEDRLDRRALRLGGCLPARARCRRAGTA